MERLIEVLERIAGRLDLLIDHLISKQEVEYLRSENRSILDNARESLEERAATWLRERAEGEEIRSVDAIASQVVRSIFGHGWWEMRDMTREKMEEKLRQGEAFYPDTFNWYSVNCSPTAEARLKSILKRLKPGKRGSKK